MVVWFIQAHLEVAALIEARLGSLRRGEGSQGSFEFAWVHSVTHSDLRVHSSSRRFKRVLLVVVGYVWVHSGSRRFRRVHSGSLGFTRTRLVVVRFIRVRVCSLGLVLVLSVSFGLAWIHSAAPRVGSVDCGWRWFTISA